MTGDQLIRALIVDDEPLARRKIRTLLKADREVEIVGDCSDGRTALSAIREKRPDLIFLDVQMPVMDGIAVLEALGAERTPHVIFVTAYDQYALRAFEFHALDYLLKPFDRKRFRVALQRAKERIHGERGGDLGRRTLALLEELRTRSGTLERLIVKSGGRVLFLKVGEIDWIEAEGKYVRLHVGKDAHLLREAMSRLESQLDPKKFLRIHRSTIVNIDRIRELQPWFHMEYRVVLQDGTRLQLSRGCRKHIQEVLGHPL
jgi:two-component system LytT family response regulator